CWPLPPPATPGAGGVGDPADAPPEAPAKVAPAEAAEAVEAAAEAAALEAAAEAAALKAAEGTSLEALEAAADALGAGHGGERRGRGLQDHGVAETMGVGHTRCAEVRSLVG